MVKIYYSLYDRMLSYKNLEKAFKKVKASKQAAGIDGQTIGEFTKKQEENLSMLMHELKTKSYRPQPVKRVEIPNRVAEQGNLAFLRFVTVLYSRHCGKFLSQYLIRDFIRPATDIGPAKVVIRPYPKPRCSYASTSSSGWWIWIYPSALIHSIMK